MAPSTTGSSGVAATAGNGTNSPPAQRRPPVNVKGTSTHIHKKPTVVPVLPLPLTKSRHRTTPTALPSPSHTPASPTAVERATKSPTSASRVRSPTSPLAVEVDLPNLGALAIASKTNGADVTSPKQDGARNGNGHQHKQLSAVDATVGVELAPASTQQQQLAPAGTAQGPPTTTTTTREPLATYRSTNAIPPPSITSSAAPDSYALPHPPRGKENIPPTANGFTMAQPPAFEAPRIPMHHPQLSLSDSSMFGARSDSNNTSPVPPETGGYERPAHLNLPPLPPPPPSGYPPSGYPQFQPHHACQPIPGIPYYPAVQGPPGQGYVLAPRTPQSFHGSQGSNPPEVPVGFEENGYQHRPQPPMAANGHPSQQPVAANDHHSQPPVTANGHLAQHQQPVATNDHIAQHQQPMAAGDHLPQQPMATNGHLLQQPIPANGHLPQPPMTANGAGVHAEVHNAFPPAPMSARQHGFVDSRSREISQMHQRDAYEYLELNFNNRETADVQVVVTFRGGPEGRPWRRPVLLYGHRLILGFSPSLRAHLQGSPHMGGTLELASDDPYQRTEVLWNCLASIYGRPLPEIPESDAFMAAAYVAAGHFLQLGAISMKGADDLIRLVDSWAQLEMACAVALDGAIHLSPGPLPPSQLTSDIILRYGHASEMLLAAIAGFVIDMFPHNYVVDSKYPLPRYTRIPAHPDAYRRDRELMAASSADAATTAPVRNESLRYSNPLLSQIKFGDVPLPNDGPADAPETQRPQPKKKATLADRLAACEADANRLLTSILANMPFCVLKDILESNGLGKGPGPSATSWPTMQTRYKIMSQIIAERESRRIDAAKAVMAGAAADPSVRDRLSGTRPPQNGPVDGWEIVGWKEEIVDVDEAPKLVRTWVPLSSSI
ncbi:hypothetical protein RB594_003217 [Gaeumannomyces avenae]